MTDETALTKVRIREQARSRRSALSQEERSRANAAIASSVLCLFDLEGARIVLAYTATAEEVDPYPIVDALRFRGLSVVMPRVEESTGLSLHLVENDSCLVAEAYGILEPQATMPVVPPHEVDVAIIPGVAFDTAGNRIGYGGGYYDRLLKMLRDDAVTIGLAFDEQVFEEVPAVEHDRPVDVVVTPTTVHRRY